MLQGKIGGSSTAHDHGARAAPGLSVGKRTLVDQLASSNQAERAVPRRDGSAALDDATSEHGNHACLDCGGAMGDGTECPTCKGQSAHNSRSGHAAQDADAIAGSPVKATALTDADRAVNLQSPLFRDDPQLQDAFDNRPSLRLGQSGPAIQKIQQALINLGFIFSRSIRDGTPDGIFGHETFLVIQGFQRRQGIQVDGVIGRQTLGELDGLLTSSHVPGTPATRAATSVRATNVRPPRFLPCGGFDWAIDWVTDGRNGYLVQEIVSFTDSRLSDGTPTAESQAAHFWEAWRVQIDGSVHGARPNDTFRTGLAPPPDEVFATQGTWQIVGNVHWVDQLEPGFNVSAVPQSNLLATTTQPSNLGSVLFARQVGGRWDCLNGRRIHVPQ